MVTESFPFISWMYDISIISFWDSLVVTDILCLTSRAPSRPTVTVTRRIKSRPFEQLLHRAGIWGDGCRDLPSQIWRTLIQVISLCTYRSASRVSEWKRCYGRYNNVDRVSSCVCFGSASAGHCIRVLALGWFRSLAEGWDASGFM
jgi:hypothetical protein